MAVQINNCIYHRNIRGSMLENSSLKSQYSKLEDQLLFLQADEEQAKKDKATYDQYNQEYEEEIAELKPTTDVYEAICDEFLISNELQVFHTVAFPSSYSLSDPVVRIYNSKGEEILNSKATEPLKLQANLSVVSVSTPDSNDKVNITFKLEIPDLDAKLFENEESEQALESVSVTSFEEVVNEATVETKYGNDQQYSGPTSGTVPVSWSDGSLLNILTVDGELSLGDVINNSVNVSVSVTGGTVSNFVLQFGNEDAQFETRPIITSLE